MDRINLIYESSMMLFCRRRSLNQRRRPGVESLEDRRVLDSTVVFSELMYHPANELVDTEWVELHNQMAVNMDVSGWTIDGIDFQFPERTTIPRGGYVVIAKDPARLAAQTGLANVFGPFPGRLSNSGERLSLRNISNREMDAIEFGDRSPWPAAADGSGATLAKRDPQSGSAQPWNWVSSVVTGGTPGAENFPEFDPTPTTSTLVARDAGWSYDESGQELGTAWRNQDFDDAGWSRGEAPLYAGSFPTIEAPGAGLGDVTAQSIVIQNPSFEANTNDGVGYGDIHGWTTLGSTGINPATGGDAPFADNGRIPDQQRIGFIQGRGSISQGIDGFELGQEYWLEIHYNARACCGNDPSITISYAGSLIMPPTSVEPVGEENDYYAAVIPFTPAAENGQLLIRNVGSVGDHTLILDAISIVPRDELQVQVQNASFEGSGFVQPEPGRLTGVQLAGWDYTGEGDYGIATEASSLHDNGQVPDGQHVVYLEGLGTLQQTIDGLVPGERYDLRYRYNARAGAPRPSVQVRIDDRLVQDVIVDPVGQAQPYHTFSRRFTAGAESIAISIQQTSAASSATLLIDDLMLRRETSPLVTEAALGPTTHYFRYEFDYAGNPAQTELAIRHFVDDGVVLYLNGAEIQRDNMPDGEVDASTMASQSVGDPAWSELISVPATQRLAGRNVLAAEVHQAQPNDPDMGFALELVATEYPVDPTIDAVTIGINEMTSVDVDTFAVELFNFGDFAVQLADHQLVIDGRATTLPDQLLLPNSRFVQSILTPIDVDDLIYVKNTKLDVIVDAWHATAGSIARLPEGDGPVYNTTATTLGEINQVDLNSSVVINEIMYHQLPTYATPGTPATFELTKLIELDGAWRFNDTGEALAGDWHQVAHPAGGNWQQGPGLLGFESGRVIEPGLGTELNDTDIITYYFETEFDVTAELFAETDGFQLRHVIDDGAIFFLNGTEFYRFNMPAGPVDSNTIAAASVNNAELSSEIVIPTELISAGTNRISVELHQRARTSSDVVFGVELAAATISDSGVAATPFVENDEEWIELLNRDDQAVDLTGWSLQDAVQFTFPEGTIIEPGEYLVIAKDPARMTTKYPNVTFLGPFTGQLSDRHERIVLRDAQQNPADQVPYFDDGRWPSAADGAGASLELLNPYADNSVAESWSASQPNSATEWKSYSFRLSGAEPEGLNVPAGFHELVIGLLDAGEILLDDVQLIEDPDGNAVDRLQNGGFESDTIGEPAARWRFVGNHNTSQVIVDPRDPSNQVLRLVATGPTEHMSNHGETTFADGARISSNATYELSFKALWMNGSPQLNSRLYFARGGTTALIETNDQQGTPGQRNGNWQENLGPAYADLAHQPIVPLADEPVVVSVTAADPNGVAQLTLHYAVGDDDFVSVPMKPDDDGRFTAIVPGQSNNATVQFYVSGRDSLGAETQFPAAGPASRALYKVSPPLDNEQGHGLRIIMKRPDISTMHRAENVMSNARLGATVVYNETEVFYDVGVRLRASGYGRRGQLAGFNIKFDPQQLFRDVHQTIALDRGAVFSNGDGSGGVRGVPGASAHELLIYQVASHAGGIGGMYDDVVYVSAPRGANTGMALLKMARYSDVFLDSQSENGGDGSLFKYELIYHPTRTIDGDPESLKQAPNSVVGTDISDLGPDQEAYRHNFILKNNRDRDDYSAIVALGQAFSMSGNQLDAATQEIMDVDQWMRTFALQSLVGTADTYNMGLAHHLELYVRPSDGKVLALPWDIDHGFYYSTNSNILGRGGSNLQKVINLPHNTRLFHKHLLDLIQTTYNTDYLSDWAQHYEEVTQHEGLANFFVNYVGDRAEFVLSRLERDAPKVPFAITTNNGNPLQVDDGRVALEGTGWIDVHTIEQLGSDDRLNVVWLDEERWRIDVPLRPGENLIQLQASSYQGDAVGTDEITVTSSISERPLHDHLRIVELMYNPPRPTAEELTVNPSWEKDNFEFVEFMNTSSTMTLDLRDVRFTDGPADPFTFDESNGLLPPGARIVLVNDPVAFAARYGSSVAIAGEFSGNLSNNGERIRIEDPQGIAIVDFSYSDAEPWPAAADGDGYSLELIDPETAAADDLKLPGRWRAGAVVGGSPTTETAIPGDLNQDGGVNAADIDHLCRATADDPAADLNGDGVVDQSDLLFMIEEILETTFGDANLDGIFDSSDFVDIFQAGQYEDEIDENSTWSTGDWNCDRDFTSGDFVVALQAGGYVQMAQPASRARIVPSLLVDTVHQRSNRQTQRSRRLQLPDSTRAVPVEWTHAVRDLVFEDFPVRWSNDAVDPTHAVSPDLAWPDRSHVSPQS